MPGDACMPNDCLARTERSANKWLEQNKVTIRSSGVKGIIGSDWPDGYWVLRPASLVASNEFGVISP